MQIHITKDGRQFGPYTEDQLAAYLKGGQIGYDDLAWVDGLTDWQPLRKICIPPAGTPPPPPASPPPPPPAPRVHSSSGELPDATLLRRLYDYERLSGILWTVLGVVQILSVVLIIAGIWNIFAGKSRLKAAKRIAEHDKYIPVAYEEITGLVVIGLINLLFGGWIGLLFVAFDFYIRDLLLKNKHLFGQEGVVDCLDEKSSRLWNLIVWIPIGLTVGLLFLVFVGAAYFAATS